MKSYRAIPELLRRNDSTVVFSMVGNTNVPWIGHGMNTGALRLVKTRHEETAINAAEGYSRSTGRIPVCSVTQGPGFANAMNGLIATAQNHVPLLMIVGESPGTKGRTTMNIDQRRLAELAGAGFHHVATAAQLEESFWAAARATRWNGTPQVLSIGDGVLDSEVELLDRTPVFRSGTELPDQESVRAAVELLKSSSRPLLLAGQGAVLAGARADLDELAALVGARVGTTLRANWFFADHPDNVGLCGDWAPADIRQVIEQTDVVLAVGASLNTFTTGNRKVFGSAQVIRCDIDPSRASAGASSTLALFGDAAATVRAVSAEWRAQGLDPRKVTGETPSMADVRASVLAADIGHQPERGLDPRQVYRTLAERLPEDRIVVTDAGRSLKTMPTLLGTRDAASFLIGNSFGSIGRSLGIGIGAAAGNPDRHVVVVSGDGGFMMAAQDLDAVRLNGLRLTVVVTNDQQLGAEAKYVEQYGLPPELIQQTLPDVEHLAKAFGGVGRVIRTLDELEGVVFDAPGLTLLDVRIDPVVDGVGALGHPS